MQIQSSQIGISSFFQNQKCLIFLIPLWFIQWCNSLIQKLKNLTFFISVYIFNSKHMDANILIQNKNHSQNISGIDFRMVLNRFEFPTPKCIFVSNFVLPSQLEQLVQNQAATSELPLTVVICAALLFVVQLPVMNSNCFSC